MAAIYFDPDLFGAYLMFPRSSGLENAGEWHRFEKLIPDIRGKSALDLGCGMGWHCRYLAEHGAAHVTGIDESRRMIGRAREKNCAPEITYRLCGIGEYEYPEEMFDLVLSNLALHYLEDLESVYKKVYQTLKKKGTFLFNIEHPTFTAGIRQEWLTDGKGEKLCWPVDGYYYPGERETDFLGFRIKKYHHTLTQILQPLISLGFTLTAIEEAMPPENMMEIPGMKDEMRRPMMLLVSARKDA